MTRVTAPASANTSSFKREDLIRKAFMDFRRAVNDTVLALQFIGSLSIVKVKQFEHGFSVRYFYDHENSHEQRNRSTTI